MYVVQKTREHIPAGHVELELVLVQPEALAQLAFGIVVLNVPAVAVVKP